MNKIFNLTQHKATPEQVVQGVVEPTPVLKDKIKELLRFEKLPEKYQIRVRVAKLVQIVVDWVSTDIGDESSYKIRWYAMIGGAPYLMRILEEELIQHGIQPLHAFSVRVSEERHNSDGSVTKTQVFEHLGFVEV